MGGVVRVDWSRRAGYVRSRHAVEVQWADEAVQDPHAVWLVPDPASQSGHSVRVIGYSGTAGMVLTVILVESDVAAGERPDGQWWGSNAWIANQRDRCLYGETEP